MNELLRSAHLQNVMKKTACFCDSHYIVCICTCTLLFSHLVLCFSVTANYADWLYIMCRTCASVMQQPAGRAVRSEDKRTVFQANYVIVYASTFKLALTIILQVILVLLLLFF